MKIPYVVVLIERDMAEKIAREVHAHEIPILQLVHDKAINPTGTAPTNPPRELDPIQEYERLIRRYGDDGKTGLPCVERVYGNLATFGQVLRQHAVDSAPLDAADAELVPADAGFNVDEARDHLEQMTKAELVKLAEEMGVDGAGQMNKAPLIDAIIAKRAEFLAAQNAAPLE